jgi:hypothetical protein
MHNKFDILDSIWDEWELYVNEEVQIPEELKNKTLKKLAEFVASLYEVKHSFIRDFAVDSFIYEYKLLHHKPDRSTVEYLYGEHVSLFDKFYCRKHHVVITTHDDERFITGQTVFCPVCNKEKFRDMKFESCFDWKQVDSEGEKFLFRMKKFNDGWNRKENFKYRIRNTIEWAKYYYRKLFKK